MLSSQQLKQFERDGYLHIEQALDPTTVLAPVEREYEARLDRLARKLVDDGTLSCTYDKLAFLARLSAIYRASGQSFEQYFNLSLPMTGVTEDTPFWVGPAVFDLIRQPRLLDLVASIMGSEIASNPVQHVRIKPPLNLVAQRKHGSGLVGNTPWHQDAAVLPPDAQTELLTVWIPITDATVQSGCLRFVRGGHRQGLRRHGYGEVDGLAIADASATDADTAVTTVPARRGDVILIHRHCPHSSLPNRGDTVRFSLDLRYHPAHQRSGREVFPSFIARSEADKSRELTDAALWRQQWREARQRLATTQGPGDDAYPWIES